jgi:hypothetical protein
MNGAILCTLEKERVRNKDFVGAIYELPLQIKTYHHSLQNISS